jgi:excisionase family DNA binding protein
MPYRFLSISEATDYLHIGESNLLTLVKRGEIPFYKKGESVVFRKQELDEWASRKIMSFSDSHLQEYHKNTSAKIHNLSKSHTIIKELLPANAVSINIQARTRPSLIREMVNLADSTGLVLMKDELIASLEEREALCSTAMPNGIALLHPRNHVPYMFEDSFIVSGRVSCGLPFGALDGSATDIFFLICCQDDRIHLHVLARLCVLCHDRKLLEAMRAAEIGEEMREVIVKAEAEWIRLNT